MYRFLARQYNWSTSRLTGALGQYSSNLCIVLLLIIRLLVNSGHLAHFRWFGRISAAVVETLMSILVTSLIMTLSDLRYQAGHREASTRMTITRISTIAMRMPIVAAALDVLAGGRAGVAGLGASGRWVTGPGVVRRRGGPAKGGT